MAYFPPWAAAATVALLAAPVADELVIDNFAGGGGASEGIEEAIGRAVNYALNHDDEAIRMHEVNHPGTIHIRNNIWRVDPLDVTEGKRVGIIWFSPDCKHFSKAKGGKPREKSIRDLAWVVVHWAKRLQEAARRAGDPNWRQIVRMMFIENVEEFRTWGPLDDDGVPIKARAGETFAKWCAELRKAGGRIEWRELRACDYGAPTIRKRFFMVIRFDGEPIVWPEPTHGKPGSPEVLSGQRLPWRTAAEIIDWSIPCPSIFERKKPLAEKTLRRIAHGIMKFVVDNPKPFIVPLTHHQAGARGASIDDPMATVTGANRGEHAIVVPHVTKFRSGSIGDAVTDPLATVTANSFIKRPGGAAPLGVVEAAIAPFTSFAQQGGRNRSAEAPLHTVTASDGDHNTVVAAHMVSVDNTSTRAGRYFHAEDPLRTVTSAGGGHAVVSAFMQKYATGNAPSGAEEPVQTSEVHAKHAVVAAHLAQFSETRAGRKLNPGHSADEPVSTIVRKGPLQAVVSSNLVKLRGGEDSHFESCGVSVEEPVHTICASGTHMAEVRAFLIKYYGAAGNGQTLDGPLHTVTHQDRFGLVTVTIEGEEYVIVDIGMRMLTPRELFNAQGFPPDYIIDRDAEGRPITKTAQVAKCGNSVCPPIARALVAANAGAAVQAEAAAA